MPAVSGLERRFRLVMEEKKKIYIQTFGCQMNVHDSDQIAALMLDAGYGPTDDPRRADLIVINTCSIREKAAEKVYSQLGRFAALKEEETVARDRRGRLPRPAMGGEVLPQEAGSLDIVFGTHNIHRLPEMVRTASLRRVQVTETAFRKNVPSLALQAVPVPGKISAFVTIMHGCNNFCSYCIVPYVRGREESRPHGGRPRRGRDAGGGGRPGGDPARAERQFLRHGDERGAVTVSRICSAISVR